MELSRFVGECHTALLSDDGKGALAYLTGERGLTLDTIKDNSIGYCSPTQSLPGESWIDKPTGQRRNQNEPLRGKIIVPICSEFGEVVAVAGRHPDKDTKGWWNMKFEKSHHIFLFNKARQHIFKDNKAYTFEGYLDGITLRQHGLLSSGVIMGTSLGCRRISLLARYCDRICLVFDNDKPKPVQPGSPKQVNPGLMGQLKSIFDLSRLGFGVISKIDLPVGIDPDEFVAANGLNAFLELEQTLSKKDIDEAKSRYKDIVASSNGRDG